jgi:hypothetical protein
LIDTLYWPPVKKVKRILLETQKGVVLKGGRTRAFGLLVPRRLKKSLTHVGLGTRAPQKGAEVKSGWEPRADNIGDWLS